MGLTEEHMQFHDGEVNDTNSCTSMSGQKLYTSHTSRHSTDTSRASNCSTDRDAGLLLCRVCHSAESDRRGDAALGFLDIVPLSQEILKINKDGDKASKRIAEKDEDSKNCGRIPGFIEFISPEGEIFVCSTDVETGSYHHQDTLFELGCSCKNDLALAHYACALKWFINHGSTTCEICGDVAKNVRPADFRKVMASLKDYEALRERTATGELTHVSTETASGVDPDAIAAIRRQRLSEISLWFNPQSHSITVSQEIADELPDNPTENVVHTDNPTTKWAIEGTGILVATGLLTVTLAWLIAPHVGKKTAKNGLHILLGGICALTVVIFLRFVVLSRIKYGPARYWAILFIFWFLVFGVWASRTHHARST
ncbi:uncharacterized protein [Elaeis guineensis]|uniref:Uncharacterized protein LOC105037099 isoform X2 n=1 Tax=Elaeis guineensis var. tenera TaxID=51953 RepID=A0A6I9QKQ5_ELAGV|nr:uncharacterized protein LOC105037099 isoform X2 [Elaeis guineensis]XP_010911112.1 uncharacterized protein LOC105037099 isoform X2 [Elaeis guineensis]XP_019703940.1 uncharacterized protein LOC105037099 isoform X2 [Elaeis guineensis]XP_029118289.1 uncharacterized protein LOC105037099 isoform X2 [Elaeis guineensis]XP_029118290.1 uncharacterized protein LOC105037099 isoform X2 [Elaeis guineensis]